MYIVMLVHTYELGHDHLSPANRTDRTNSMYEDEHLEADYEDANGGEVDTSEEDDYWDEEDEDLENLPQWDGEGMSVFPPINTD